MNFFEQQLKSVFNELDNVRYIGRACYIPLDHEAKIKAQFVTVGNADKYEALKLSVINGNEGVTDSLMLNFSDYFKQMHGIAIECCPHIWNYNGKTEWYGMPTQSEFLSLKEAACDYVKVFQPEQDIYQNEEMEMM